MGYFLLPFEFRTSSTLTIGRLVTFLIAPFGYFLLFILWRALWAKELLDYSFFALPIFFVAEYLVIRARWEKPSKLAYRISPRFATPITSAIIRGVLDCLPAVGFLLIKQTLLPFNLFVPFIYEAEISLFTSIPVLLTFWALAILIPFGLFIILKRFRILLSVYLSLFIISFGFLSIYNLYDRITKTDSDLDPLIKVLCQRDGLTKTAQTNATFIARDIYVEDDTIFASFGSTVGVLSEFGDLIRHLIFEKKAKPTISLVKFDARLGKLDVFYGSTVKYIFSRPQDPYLYFASWYKYSISRIKKWGGTPQRYDTRFMRDALQRWDKSLPILSIIDLYVDKANENLYFSTDEVPACFKMNLKSMRIRGEVNLLKLKLAVYGSGLRRIHVDPKEQYMYLVPYAAQAKIVKINLKEFKIEKWRASDKRFGLFSFYHGVAFDWNRSIGYGFSYDGLTIEAFSLFDLETMYKVPTGLLSYRLQVRGARVLEDGRVIGVTYHGEIFLFDPERKKLSILCKRTGGRTDNLELVGGYIYLNNYAGIVRIPLDRLLERVENKASD